MASSSFFCEFIDLDFVSFHTDTRIQKNLHGQYPAILTSHLVNNSYLLYSCRFSRYSAFTHWLVHGHMTSNIETVSRQMPWAGNIAKTVTSNGKQFTVTREMLTAVAGISACYSKFAFVLFCYITNHWSLGEQWILLPSNLNVSLDFLSGNIEILGKQNSLFPSGPVIKCLLLTDIHDFTTILYVILRHDSFEWLKQSIRFGNCNMVPWLSLLWFCFLHYSF